MTKLLLIIYLLIPVFAFSQLFSTKQKCKDINDLVFSITNNYDQAKDTVQLRKTIEKFADQKNINDTQVYPIIENVFVANKNADLLDRLNNRSTQLFQNAIRLAVKADRKDFIIWTQINYAFYLYKFRKYKTAFPYFVKTIKFLENNHDQELIQPAKTYIKMGYFSDTVGENVKAIEFLKRAKSYTEENATEMASILDNIGNNLVKINNHTEAETYYEEAKLWAVKRNDPVRYGKILGNIGIMKIKEKKYAEAEKLILQDLSISTKFKSHQNSMFALIQLSKAYIGQQKFNFAQSTLERADKIAKSKIYFKSSELDIFKLNLVVAQNLKNDNQELAIRRKLQSLEKELKNIDGEEAIALINWNTQKEIFQLQLAAEKEKSEKEYIQKIAALVVCVFLLIFLYFFIKILRNKHKITKSEFEKKLLTLSVDQLKSEKKFNDSRQTLQSFLNYLSEKNEQIDHLSYEIEKLKSSKSIDLEEKSGKLQVLLESHLMTDEKWFSFKTAYIKEYNAEYQKILSDYPDLTDSNLRIIILTRLGITQSEMGKILGVTTDAIKKAKQRLRKKYQRELSK